MLPADADRFDPGDHREGCFVLHTSLVRPDHKCLRRSHRADPESSEADNEAGGNGLSEAGEIFSEVDIWGMDSLGQEDGLRVNECSWRFLVAGSPPRDISAPLDTYRRRRTGRFTDGAHER